MPRPPADVPIHLRPFVAHGVDFDRAYTSSDSEACGECPFCGKNKFFVGLRDIDAKHFAGGWTCQVCGDGGNVYRFLTKVWSESFRRQADDADDILAVAQERGLPSGFFHDYGFCKSVTTGEWVVPGYCAGGTVVNLYRWRGVGGGKRALMATPGEGVVPLGLFRANHEPSDYDFVDVCEGVWDAAAWRWALSGADPARSERTLVIGTPGCNVWNEGWSKVCAGKVVTVLYDNDHPRVNARSGAVTQPALAGVKRVATALTTCADPPKEVSYLCWGGVTEYHNSSMTDGYDLRDLVRDSVERATEFVDSLVRPVPSEWTRPSPPKNVVNGGAGGGLTPLSCTSYPELIGAWKDADHHTPDFEGGLVFSLAVASSVDYGECQLWGKLIGVGSTGKSTVCDGLGVANKYVVTDSSVNDLYSGAIREDGRDHSFAARLRGVCWINNDGDVLLRNPNREKILSQMRELYGGKGSKAFGNGIGSRSYVGLRFTSLIAGTHSLKELDSADLGGRYVDYVFEAPSEALKRQMGLAAIRHQTSGTVGGSGMTAAKERATRLTGGYLIHLRERVTSLSSQIGVTDAQALRVYLLADYVAKMRSRPPKTQDEHTDNVEMPTRLCKQLSTLAVFSAVVRGRPAIDVAAMNLVRRVALDTAAGRTQRIVAAIARSGTAGLDMRGILLETRRDADREYELVNYLTETGILEEYGDGAGYARKSRWRLSASFVSVYRSVFATSGVTK